MNAFFKNNFLRSEFSQKSQWRWWTGLLAGAGTMIIPMLIGAIIVAAFIFSQNSMADIAAKKITNISLTGMTLAVIISQILTILLAIAFTRYTTPAWQSSLYLTGFSKLRESLIPIIAVAVLIVIGTVIWEYIFASALDNDANSLKNLLQAPETKFAAIILAVVGAPFSEEILFRGFLLPPLAKTRFGFLGASLFTSLVWAAIHGYSWQGAAEIFMVGLAFSYLLWRTGSIIPSIILHALFNLAAVAVNFMTTS